MQQKTACVVVKLINQDSCRQEMKKFSAEAKRPNRRPTLNVFTPLGLLGGFRGQIDLLCGKGEKKL